MASKFLNLSTDNTLGGVSPSNEIVPSQKAIKEYVDNQGGGAAIDNSTITKNSSNELQAEAVVNMNSASGATNPLYHWQGTLAEYTAQNIEVLHPDWVCIVTDDSATIAWGDITGSISNQTDLSNALDAKQATLVSGTNIKTINSTSLLGSGNLAVQETLVSGTNIKTINNTSILGSGNISISANPSIDGKSITTNSSDELQTIGVINQNDTTTALKVWHGTQAEYDALVTHDANTRYYTDGGLNVSLLSVIYPVGSIYITTNSSCPLSTLIAGSTWVLVGQDRVLQGAGLRGVVGTTLNESLPNIKGGFNGSYAGLGGVPNIKGGYGSFDDAGSIGTTITQNYANSNSATTDARDTNWIDFDASRSSSTYQDNAPVQPDAYLVNIYRRIS